MIERKPYKAIWEELSLDKSMILLAGPRQCGKTTFARMLSDDFANSLYFNWDIPTDKKRLVQDPFFFQGLTRKDTSVPLVILDEIHKYKDWKNYLKGVFDHFPNDFLFLVSGSGRLDIYQQGGDSLAGRYFSFHLWPLTLAELQGCDIPFQQFRHNLTSVTTEDTTACRNSWQRLAAFSGFPEPYLAAKPTTYQRWSTTYHRQLIREDIRDLTGVKQVDDIEILFSLLPEKVGSPLSIPNLATDLKATYNTVKNWLSIFERFYLTFSITPWTAGISRAIHKERKLYLFDYAGITDAAAKFENMVALELFRAISNWNDTGWGDFGLHYIRTKEGREVDFLISENRKPMFLVETKLGVQSPSKNLTRTMKTLSVPGIQLHDRGETFKHLPHEHHPLLIAPASMWLPMLP